MINYLNIKNKKENKPEKLYKDNQEQEFDII